MINIGILNSYTIITAHIIFYFKVMQIAQALDMNILVHSRTPREDEKDIHYVSLEELLKNSDYVSMHCPLTESTKHMINKEFLFWLII